MIPSEKNLWLSPNQICIARGNATARNLMFETKKDHKVFLQLWDKYLGNMTEVINYHLSPTDWTILFKTKSAEQITAAYIEQRKKSKKAKRKSTLHEPKRMISEHIRIFLSQFVKKANQQNGRKGSLVMERFHKYILKSHADYQKIFSIISNQVRIPIQRSKYRADESLYDVKKEIRVNGMLRVGNECYGGLKGRYKKGFGGMECMGLTLPNSSVLRHFFKSLNPTQNPLNSS